MKDKITIRFGVKYWISYAFICLLSILVLIIGSVLFSNDNLIWKILFYIVISLIIVGFLIATLYNYQFAIIHNDSIVIRSLICIFVKTNINDITDIKKENLPTFRNNLGFTSSNDWIMIYTKASTKDKKLYGLNKKNNSPYKIPYSDKNWHIMQSFNIHKKDN